MPSGRSTNTECLRDPQRPKLSITHLQLQAVGLPGPVLTSHHSHNPIGETTDPEMHRSARKRRREGHRLRRRRFGSCAAGCGSGFKAPVAPNAGSLGIRQVAWGNEKCRNPNRTPKGGPQVCCVLESLVRAAVHLHPPLLSLMSACCSLQLRTRGPQFVFVVFFPPDLAFLHGNNMDASSFGITEGCPCIRFPNSFLTIGP